MSECPIVQNLALFVIFGLTPLRRSIGMGSLILPRGLIVVLGKDLYAVEG